MPGLALRAPRGGASASVSAEQAVTALALDAGLAPAEPFRTLEPAFAAGETAVLSDGGLTRLPVRARLVYGEDDRGTLRLAWQTTLYLDAGDADWYGLVDARTGQVFERENVLLNESFGEPVSLAPVAEAPAAPPSLVRADAPLDLLGGATYRVFVAPNESPIHTSTPPPADGRVLVSGAADADASPFGWHDTDGQPGPEFTRAQGNNTHAYADLNDNGTAQPNEETEGGLSLTFDFPIDFAQDPRAYQDASTTNLFYWNNVFHDVMHRHGFDAASGNFQQNNYGQGGIGNDPIQAEAQDGVVTCSRTSCANNANFSTSPDGQAGRMQMYLWNVGGTPRLDGSLDAGIIVHEYGHGVSKRLSGGPSNSSCLTDQEQMGEGWSDFYGLMMTMKPTDTRTTRRGIGVYALGQPVTGGGIRTAPYQPAPGAPYTTDFAVNSATYGSTVTAGQSGSLSRPHGVGFVWATALWEVTWDMIDAFGFSPDLYDADGTAGNQMMMSLVTEGLKLQGCEVGFVSGRDAILAADVALYNGAHTELLGTAFARRGLGVGASEGSTDSNSDNVESFAEPETIAPAPVTDLAVVPNGDYVTLTFTATGDDGPVGTASLYDVRRSTAPILTDADFEAATPVAVAARPAAAGTAEAVVAAGLAFETTYHFAIKVADDSFNVSALSNSAQATTLAAPVATVPTAPIEVVTSGTAQATLTIANAGPSDLRYAVSLAGTTPRPAAAPAGAPAPDAPEDKDAPETSGQAQRLGSGGPDAFGYRWADSDEPGGPVYDFVDISTTGTPVTLGDDASTSVDLPFTFPFYGVDQTTVRIVSNGWLGFGGTSSAFSNAPIPTASAPNNMIAGFWDDLNPARGGSVVYETSPDGNQFVVQYTDVPRFSSGTGTITFQIILSRSGAMTVQYESVPTTLNSATVGIENASGTDGLQVVHNGEYVRSGLAVRFASLFVSAGTTAGLIPAGESRDVVLDFDATGLAQGTYTADLTVTTNSPDAATTVIPVILTVGTVSEEAGALAFEGTHLLGAVYPNPAQGASRVALAVAEAQTVRAELYDALGRRVSVLFDGPLAARAQVDVPVASRELAAGTYVLRIVGETFTDARRVTVVR